MELPGDTKVCPRCAETIKMAARICPFCQSRFSWLGLWREELVGTMLLLACIAAATALVAMVEHSESAEGRAAAQLRLAKQHRADLPVLDARAEVKPRTNTLAILGVVTNTGSGSWRVEEIEARLLDSAGTLLDARQLSVAPGFVVPPRGAHAFRAEFGPSARTNNLRAEVRVCRLTDSRIPVDDD